MAWKYILQPKSQLRKLLLHTGVLQLLALAQLQRFRHDFNFISIPRSILQGRSRTKHFLFSSRFL